MFFCRVFYVYDQPGFAKVFLGDVLCAGGGTQTARDSKVSGQE